MLRVCGITYTHSPNYGSCLQTYALQQAVESLEIGGEACSYRVIPIQIMKDYPVKGWSQRVIRPFLAWNRLQYRPFYRKYMKYADCAYIRDLPGLNRQFDAFVCGSDVIWNDSFNNRVGAYYLDFAEKYRFSYAASFGKTNITEDYIRFATPKIDRLDAVSVREPSAVEIAAKCTQKPVKVVADPVLLLEPAHWKTIAVQKSRTDKYIFVYATHLGDTIRQYVEKLKAATGLRVVWAVAGPKQALKMGMLQVQRPEEWLGLLRDAQYVVTNSFHCTAFSVLFHKKFFTVVQGEKDKGINVRMNDFLNTVGLGERIFSAVPETLDLGDVDFTEADQRIAALREESLAYLRENLEEAYRRKQPAENGKEDT